MQRKDVSVCGKIFKHLDVDVWGNIDAVRLVSMPQCISEMFVYRQLTQ